MRANRTVQAFFDLPSAALRAWKKSSLGVLLCGAFDSLKPASRILTKGSGAYCCSTRHSLEHACKRERLQGRMLFGPGGCDPEEVPGKRWTVTEMLGGKNALGFSPGHPLRTMSTVQFSRRANPLSFQLRSGGRISIAELADYITYH